MKMIHMVGAPPLYTNTFLLIGNEGHAVVIDPAVPVAKIDEALTQNNASLTHVFLTHGHPDHTATLEEVLAQYHPRFYMNLADAAHYRLSPDEGFEDFGVVQVDDMAFKTIFTPGHTRGSTVILCGDWAFTGDTLFAGDIGRTDFFDSNPEDMRKSLKKIVDNVKGNPKVLPGHEEFSTMEAERQGNPYLRFP